MFAADVSFTGYVKNMQSQPIQNYWVFFRFTAPAYLPAEFSMNGPAIQTDQNGRYSFSLTNIPSGVLYSAKIYVYDYNFNCVEKTFSFYADGCSYNVYTIYTTVHNPTNSQTTFQEEENCTHCPASLSLHNTSTPNLLNSPLTKWEWTNQQIVFSENESTDYFISSPESSVVKLKATLTDPYTNFTFFSSEKSKELVSDTSFFFHAGGQVFSNGEPVNESGVVLYRRIQDNYISVDTMLVGLYGYYYFTHLPNCSYIVKAFPDVDQFRSENYLPTYYPGAATWTAAQSFSNSNASSTMTITLLGSSEQTGVYTVSGTVVYPDYSPVSACELLLFNSEMQPLHYTLSETNGEFVIENLAGGSYFLIYDIPGIVPDPLQIILDDMNPNVQVEIVVGTTTAIVAQESLATVVFPNPFTDVFSVSLGQCSSSAHTVVLRTIEGKITYVTTHKPEEKTIHLSVPHLPSGTYILEIHNTSENTRESHVIVKF